MIGSAKKAFILFIISAFLFTCLACAGGWVVEPFTRPPITEKPQTSSDVSPAPDTSASLDPEASSISFKNELASMITELYISPSETDKWGEAVFYDIMSGEAEKIDFSWFNGVSGERYDIGTIDENGVNYDCYDVVLIDGDRIILSINAGNAEFEIERASGKLDFIDAVVYSDEPGEEKRSVFIRPYLSTESAHSSSGDDVYALYTQTSVRLSSAAEERFPLLDQALNALHKKRSEASSEAYREIAEIAESAYQSAHPGSSFAAAEFSDNAFIISSEENIFSILFERRERFGDDSIIVYEAANFDPQTGEELMLSDVVVAVQKLQLFIYSELEKDYGGIPFDEDTELISEFSAPSEKLSWFIEPQGLHVLIDGVPFGGEDMLYSAYLSFGEYKDIIQEKYIPKSENHASAFPLDFDYRTLIEGKSSLINISASFDEEHQLRIQYNGAVHESELTGVYEVKPLLVRSNGRDLLYLDMLSDNDQRLLSIYSLEDDAIVHLGEFHCTWGYSYESTADSMTRLVQSMVDPEAFTLYSETVLLGSAYGEKMYFVGEDGMPQSEDKYFIIISPDLEFELKQPLELHLVTEAGDMDVSTVSLDAGSILTYYRTDNERFADLSLDDGRFVRAVIDDGCIDSIPLDEIFGGIVYFG
ncbi:MAG: hypothetical protein IKZ82_14250 [Clostridia bacterium]|nr:hypothetical protein [Clostridia bacterium]